MALKDYAAQFPNTDEHARLQALLSQDAETNPEHAFAVPGRSQSLHLRFSEFETVKALLERFVEMAAQKLSLAVSERMEATDWLQCPPPAEVTHLVEAMLKGHDSHGVQMLSGYGILLRCPHPTPAAGPARRRPDP